ncbi:MAG: hypothetical protein MUP68_06750 [Deltaproteobacteria bacterium]|nr:hypothetical protein [Deltaproteobacteria bacterium]
MAYILRRGDIRIGTDADLTLVILNRVKTVQAKDFEMFSDHLPCEGLEIKGWPVMTLVRGKMIMKDGKVVGNVGWGRFLAR